MASANEKNAILERWDVTLRDSADRAALFDERGGTTHSFRGIEKEAEHRADELKAVPRGTILGIQIGNSPSWPAVLLAAWRAGLIPLPLGGHVEKTELAGLLEALQVGALAEVTSGEVVVRSLETGALPAFEGPTPHLLKLTSGTTSAPRAIRFRALQLAADADHICETMGFGREDRNYGVIPLSHSYGFSNLLTPLLCRGVPLVLSHDRMPRAILEGLARSRATVFPGMPVFYQTLAGLDAPAPLPDLRLCISAGAPLPPAVGRAFSAKFGRKIHTFYGSSECGAISYDTSEGDYGEGFVGQEMNGVQLRLREDSRLEVRSDAVGDGYWPEPDPAILGEGRFLTGDLVERRGEGFCLVGRTADVINVAGRKLNPLDVEQRIARMEGVREVVVFGVPSTLRSEQAIACVVAEAAVDQEALIRECRNALSTWQMPRDFWFVDQLPVNERGKTSRRELAMRYAQR